MHVIKAAAAACAVAMMPFAAQADGMSYSYVDLGWVQTDIDGISSKPDGFGLRGSVGFGEHFFVFAEFSDQSVSSVDFEQYAVGLGGHWALSDRLDFVGRAGWVKGEASGGGFSFDADGYLVSAGLRGRLGENVELEGHVIHTDVGGSDGDDTALAVGARWHFNRNFAIGAEYRHSDDSSTVLVGVRLSF